MQFYPGLMFCLYGHGHHTEEHDIFENGTIYYEIASVEKREYRIFTITPKGYSNEVIKRGIENITRTESKVLL